MEFLGLLVGLVLTLCIYSYILGDNWLYRFATHVLVGVSAAYAAVTVWQGVLWPAVSRMVSQLQANPLAVPSNTLLIIPILLGLLLLLSRASTSSIRAGNVAVAVLIGIGAAVAFVGAVIGTLLPQLTATSANAVLGVITAVLTVCALLYFQFTIRTQPEQVEHVPAYQRILGDGIGRGVIMITFGALYASAIITSLTLLTNQMEDIINFVFSLLT